MHSGIEQNRTYGEKYWWVAFAIAIIGIVIVSVSLSDLKELPMTIIGAVLGVAMTIFATYFLFKGQANQQSELAEKQSHLQAEILERQSELQIDMFRRQNELEQKAIKDAEIFKEKLNTYQKFLDALCKYITTKSDEAQLELKFRTAALAMHGDSLQLTALNQEISKIIAFYADEVPDDKELIHSLFSIAELFGTELYPGRDFVRNAEYGTSIENLACVIDASASSSELSEIEAEDKASEKSDEQEAENMESWAQKLSELKSNGWNVVIDPVKDTILMNNPIAQHNISFYKKGRFYVVQSQGEKGDSEYSKTLKALHKGSRRSNIWWRELTSLPNYGVSNGLSKAVETNSKARAVVVKWIDRLINI